MAAVASAVTPRARPVPKVPARVRRFMASRIGRLACAIFKGSQRADKFAGMDLVPTRRALHALAEQVISPLRVQATGNEIALPPRPGGFGGVGVSGTDVVRADGAQGAITSLRAAAAFVGLQSAQALSDEPVTLDL